MFNHSVQVGGSQSNSQQGRGGGGNCTPEASRAAHAAAGSGVGVRSDEGQPISNTRLSNFDGGHRCLYRGLDWISKTVQVTPDELVDWLNWIVPAVGSEVTRAGRSCFVKTAGGPQGFRLLLGDGLSISLPGLDSSSDRVVITGTSEWCAGRDHRTADDDLASVLLDVLGLDVAGRVVGLSRADVTADFLMPESDAAEFFGLARSEAVVSRARDRAAYQRGKRWTGSKFGRQSVVLRLYDKLAEVVQKGALPAWLKLWGLDAVPDGFVVVRVEWQLRGSWLRDRGVWTVADLLASVGTLLNYLNSSWFRLAGPKSGPLNKRESLPVWASIASLMASGPFSGIVGGIKLLRVPSVNLDAALAQAAGVLAWVASCLGAGADDGVIPEFSDVAEYMRRRVRPDWWSERVAKRMVAARYGVAA